MKYLFAISAILLCACTDYQSDWENKWGSAFTAPTADVPNTPTPILICYEGSTTALTNNNCTTNFVCSGNNWVQVGNPVCQNANTTPTPIVIPVVTLGTMTDSRDKQQYVTTTIGKQIWMAENLNYTDQSTLMMKNSWCYDNAEKNCAQFGNHKYGRLYAWDAANKACPKGWHLPTKQEFDLLLTSVGGEAIAGNMLKAQSNGWPAGGEGINAYGFSVLPAGYRYNQGGFYNVNQIANFWTSTEDASGGAYRVSIDTQTNARPGTDLKGYGFSVRCLKN